MTTYDRLVGQRLFTAEGAEVGIVACVKRKALIVTPTGKTSARRRPAVSSSETSVEAADRLSALTDKEIRCYRMLVEAGMYGATDFEGAVLAQMSEGTYRARRIYLRDRGLVCDSGLRRLTASGRRAVVWMVKQAGDHAP